MWELPKWHGIVSRRYRMHQVSEWHICYLQQRDVLGMFKQHMGGFRNAGCMFSVPIAIHGIICP